jgi:hypothetical protein
LLGNSLFSTPCVKNVGFNQRDKIFDSDFLIILASSSFSMLILEYTLFGCTNGYLILVMPLLDFKQIFTIKFNVLI